MGPLMVLSEIGSQGKKGIEKEKKEEGTSNLQILQEQTLNFLTFDEDRNQFPEFL